MLIPRILTATIDEKLHKGRAIVVLGPRQTGKTTLIRNLLNSKGDYLFLDCDDLYVRSRLEQANTEEIRQIIGPSELVFIDEAQRVENIGLTLKIIVDQFKQVQCIVSGSSSLDLANKINEPLTGRKWPLMLFPICWKEFEEYAGFLKAQQQLENRLIYGMYPSVIMNQGGEAAVLNELTESYLYKDVLNLGGIRRPELLSKILRALALQLGNEVSYNELSTLVQADKNTVQNYIDLLEKTFVIFRLPALRRNLRNEVSSSRKIYFFDNGIRNSLISNLNPLDLRNDAGALWENFLVSERLKYLSYRKISANSYFWRTTRQQEIDYIEESGGELKAWEFKFNPKIKTRIPDLFTETYHSEVVVVHRNNYRDFILW